ncbi:hypothetical protein F4814DRAFT_430363 [Daldinia grandis]|nr:hypothetical protein F4814DRAFT_430363 [Daldinia grandis]
MTKTSFIIEYDMYGACGDTKRLLSNLPCTNKALWLGASQVYVHPAGNIKPPQLSMDLLSQHHATHSSAPKLLPREASYSTQ